LRNEIILTMDQTTVGIIPEDNIEYQVRLGDTFIKPHSEKIYHSLQYAFKPSSIQSQGLLKKAKEGVLELEFLNSQPPQDQTNAEHPQHSYYFRGNYQYSKDVDCILIFEGPEKGFRLEKLSGSAKGLKPGPKASNSISSSNVPPSVPVSLTTNGKRNADFDHHVDAKRHSPPAPVVEVITPETGKKDEDDSEDESSSGEDEDIVADIENNMDHDEPSPATNAVSNTTPTTIATTEQPSQSNSVFSSDSSSDSSSSSSDSDSADEK